MEHGIFISYRRTYAHFAGRIFDYLYNKGLDPFMDVYKNEPGYFEPRLQQMIISCPYFLLVLQKNCLDNPEASEIFCNEIKVALEQKAPEDIMIVSEADFEFPEDLPEVFKDLPYIQRYKITHESFYDDMSALIKKFEMSKLSGSINWHEHIVKNGQTLITSRFVFENDYASMASRFGKDLIEAVQTGKHIEPTVQRIQQIHMSCFAASLVFNPARDMVDDRAFDNGMLFNVFAELLRDPQFSMEIIINAPDSIGAKEAIRNNMLGNSALEEYPEAVFYSAFAGVNRLILEDDVFRIAYKEKRFRFYLTDIVMNGALLQIEYKQGWTKFDHIKYDIYTYNPRSNMDRRCMIFFKDKELDNYDFMVNTYNYLKEHKYTKEQIKKQEKNWLEHWKKIQENLQ